MEKQQTKILLVDDEPDICEQLSGLLRDIGYSCEYTTSSEKGLELFKKKKCIILRIIIYKNYLKFEFC